MDGHDLCFYTACELCSPPDIVTFVEISTSISLVVTRIRTIRENTKNFTVSLLTMSDRRRRQKRFYKLFHSVLISPFMGFDDDLQIANFLLMMIYRLSTLIGALGTAWRVRDFIVRDFAGTRRRVVALWRCRCALWVLIVAYYLLTVNNMRAQVRFHVVLIKLCGEGGKSTREGKQLM